MITFYLIYHKDFAISVFVSYCFVSPLDSPIYLRPTQPLANADMSRGVEGIKLTLLRVISSTINVLCVHVSSTLIAPQIKISKKHFLGI